VPAYKFAGNAAYCTFRRCHATAAAISDNTASARIAAAGLAGDEQHDTYEKVAWLLAARRFRDVATDTGIFVAGQQAVNIVDKIGFATCCGHADPP